MHEFTAKMVAMDDSAAFKASMIVFSENEYGSGKMLEIQRAAAFDESDRMNGLDTYSLGVESGVTFYGGVVGWQIQGRNLGLTLTSEACLGLGITDGIAIQIDSSVVSMSALEKTIAKILE